MITKFADVFAELKEKGVCKRLVAAWAVDEHTIVACAKASELGFVKVTLVGDKELIRETCQKNNRPRRLLRMPLAMPGAASQRWGRSCASACGLRICGER